MMAGRVGCVEIVTSFNPANTAAAGLYTSLGFQPTGEIEDDEPLLLCGSPIVARMGTRDGRRHWDWTRSTAPRRYETGSRNRSASCGVG